MYNREAHVQVSIRHNAEASHDSIIIQTMQIPKLHLLCDEVEKCVMALALYAPIPPADAHE